MDDDRADEGHDDHEACACPTSRRAPVITASISSGCTTMSGRHDRPSDGATVVRTLVPKRIEKRDHFLEHPDLVGLLREAMALIGKHDDVERHPSPW